MPCGIMRVHYCFCARTSFFLSEDSCQSARRINLGGKCSIHALDLTDDPVGWLSVETLKIFYFAGGLRGNRFAIHDKRVSPSLVLYHPITPNLWLKWYLSFANWNWPGSIFTIVTLINLMSYSARNKGAFRWITFVLIFAVCAGELILGYRRVSIPRR